MSEILVKNVTVVTQLERLSEQAYDNTTALSATNQQVAQSFTTDGAFSLSQVELLMRKVGAPTGDVGYAVDIYTVSGGLPSVLLASSERVKFSDIPFKAPEASSVGRTVFKFATPLALSATTQYFFAIRYDNVGGVTVDINNTAKPLFSTGAGAGGELLASKNIYDMADTWGSDLEDDYPSGGTPYRLLSTETLNVSVGPFQLFVSADDPSTSAIGLMYYNSTLNKLKFYDGVSWKTVTST